MDMQHRDYVERRIIVEYGRRYVYLTLADANGKIISGREEVFTQPFVLERKDSWEEADDCWQSVYQWLLDVVVFPLPDKGGEPRESDEEDSSP
jgi:hypothetical protein